MSKLIVLSNRVSLPNPDKPAAGGLAVALQDALTESGGIWLGWNGDIVADGETTPFGLLQQGNIEYLTCPLNQTEYEQYYCGFANNTLWPAMHERQDLIEYQTDEFETYQQVNRKFARQLQQIAQPNDVIWIHDYHFFSVAGHCRELGLRNKIGFFLHIPFAPLNIWAQIPVAKQLIADLCHYDLIGLQTEYDQNLCLQACTTLLKAPKLQHNLISYQQRVCAINCYPIGINPLHIQQVAKHYAKAEQQVFEPESLRQKTIIGVDRVDYSKGILERFDAFAEFLNQYPEYQQRITELQIACPCRMDILAYQNLFNQVNRTVEKINAMYARHNWRPIDCTHEVVGHEALMGLYRQTDICWISSLRDGMNLVAKEYIAAQEPDNPGVLILSRYAGAAEQMQDAILVDPTDTQAMVDALKQAIEMPRDERIQRYQKLMAGLEAYDINDWRNHFLDDLRKNHALNSTAPDSNTSSVRTVNQAYTLL